MSAPKDRRKPLSDLQNGAENRIPISTGPQKAGISKPPGLAATTNKRLGKQSRIPRAPTGLRRQTVSAVHRVSEAEKPVPSRLGTAQKRSVPPQTSSTVRHTAPENGRRATASLTFTRGAPPRGSAVRGKPTGVANDGARTLEMISSKQDAILASLTAEQKAAATGKGQNAEELRLHYESIAKHIDSNQNEREARFFKMADEALQLKSDLLEATKSLQTQTESQLRQEEEKVIALNKQVEELENTIAKLEGLKAESMEDSQAVTEKITALQKQISQAELEHATVVAENQKLQLETAKHMKARDGLELEAGALTAKVKELQRRIDVSETEVASKDSEARRLRREKETAETERGELENALQKKSVTLQEARDNYERVTLTLEALKHSQEEMKNLAAQEMNSLKTEATSHLSALQKELEESKRFGQSCSAELENRKQELVHMREAIALQESNMSRANCEKMSLEAKISALHGEVNLKANEIASMMKRDSEQMNLIASLEQQAREDAALRRKLHNAIQELKGNIRVFCRVRPLIGKELDSPQAASAQLMFDYIEKGQGVVAKPPLSENKPNLQTYPFKFDKVFVPTCGQDTVFEEISQLVQSALDGYRVCIFAYGQTGSGKTHTMMGQRGDGDAQLGMVPRSVRQVFETAKHLEKDQWIFKLKASFLEIYNESVRDLLCSNGNGQKGKGKDEKQHRIIFHPETKLSTVSDLTVIDVKNEDHVQRLIDKSMKNRSTAATQANERSSRSHSVFRLQIEGHNASTGQRLNGLLNLVDLAGSERLTQSKAEGERLRETRHINKSLSALGDVIAALANNEKHIPFRNSKLTHLLQDSLGGDCKTLMFVNVSPVVESFNESLCSLRFAAKVNSCHVGTARRSAKIEF